jgi:DNA-binding response OmpR family regulator
MSKRLVLLADDDEDTVAAYEALFRARGYATEVASDGPAVIFKALELRPDIIVLDLGLPLMDGLEVLRRLRAADLPRIPVMVVTGRAFPEALVAAQREGGDDVVTKPCEPLDLCRRVEALLQMTPDRPARNSPRGDATSGQIRIPRARYARRVREQAARHLSGAWPTLLNHKLWVRAQALERQASVLRRTAAELRARALQIRSRIALRWPAAPRELAPLAG